MGRRTTGGAVEVAEEGALMSAIRQLPFEQISNVFLFYFPLLPPSPADMFSLPTYLSPIMHQTNSEKKKD